HFHCKLERLCAYIVRRVAQGAPPKGAAVRLKGTARSSCSFVTGITVPSAAIQYKRVSGIVIFSWLADVAIEEGTGQVQIPPCVLLMLFEMPSCCAPCFSLRAALAPKTSRAFIPRVM